MIGKNPFELGKNFDLALGMGPYFGPMRALEKDLVLKSCFIPCDVNGGDNFSINIEVNGEKQSTFQKTLISQGYTYKYTLILHKAQEKM